MRSLLAFTFFIASMAAVAQKNDFYPSADSIVVTGLDNKQIIFTISELISMPDSVLGETKILNHRGEFKANFKQVKAIPLKKLLESSVATIKPKELNSTYFSCKAMDGYKVVFSYNEIFNSSSASFFLLTAYDNFDLKSIPERPVVLTITSPGNGRLGMRGLKSIEIKRAE